MKPTTYGLWYITNEWEHDDGSEPRPDLLTVPLDDYNKLLDQVKWLEFNLAQANAEVRKGREIIEFVEKNDPSPDLSADKYRDAYWRVMTRLEEFYASYID
jgi:hypothetical protein